MAGYGEGIATGVGEGLVLFANGLMWIEVMWFFIALAIGIPWVIWDEISLRRTASRKSSQKDEESTHIENA